MKRLISAVLILSSMSLPASDLVRLGAGARALGMSGISGLARDPLAALTANPAFLTSQPSSIQAGITTILADSSFSNALTANAEADAGPGFIPDLAAVWSPEDSRFTLGLGVAAQSALKAAFRFKDPPGILGVSYGEQPHKAEYIVVRASAMFAYALNDRLSAGASLGLAWNRNRLKAPYIFQSHPVLGGLKVLVSLDTDDLDMTATLGLDYQVSERLALYLSYALETGFEASGDLKGNLSGLGLGIAPEFNYDAAVSTAMPRTVSGGLVVQASDTLDLGLQLDWINWARSFDTLPLRLQNGSNPALNGLLGMDSIDDTAPLDWCDQYVIHLGGEYRYSQRLSLRAGYEYGTVPVPVATMTPMTGAILNHAMSIGLGYRLDDIELDLAYRWSINNRVDVNDSLLLGGEYDNTSLTVGLHTFGVSILF